MFHRLFTKAASVKQPLVDESNTLRKVVADVEERVHRLEIAQKRLTEALELAELSVAKLRGRVTGGLRHNETPPVDRIPRGDKASLRARAGLTTVPNGRNDE
jgi:hypothetical protein